MLNEIQEILIHEERQFEIDIKLANSKYYSATVEITNNNATLEIFGEVSGNEEIISYEHFKGDNIEYLEGVNSTYKFHFYDSSVFYYKQRSIYGISDRSAFHIKLNIKYFHLSNAHSGSGSKNNIYSSIKIYSPTITKWLGITKKQLEIFKSSSKEKLPSKDYDLLCEFGIEIENQFNFNILYNSRWRRDYNGQNTTSEFPPSLNVDFRGHYPDFTGVKNIIKKITSIFYVLTGQSILIEKAYLCFPRHTKPVPLYLTGSSRFGNEIENKDMLLCYNSDHLFDKEHEPVFPVESFRTFFYLRRARKMSLKSFRYTTK